MGVAPAGRGAVIPTKGEGQSYPMVSLGIDHSSSGGGGLENKSPEREQRRQSVRSFPRVGAGKARREIGGEHLS